MVTSKWIWFIEAGKSESGKTHRWNVITQDGSIPLGQVRWYSPWRKYAFFPEDATLFEIQCLRDIATFLEEQMAYHKEMLSTG